MKILALSNLYPPNAVGGYERLCCEVMSELAERGHDVAVLTSDYGTKQQAFANQRVLKRLRLLATDNNIYAPFEATPEQRAAINAHNIEQLRRTLAEEQPDLIFVWNLYFLDNSLSSALPTAIPRVYLLTDNWLISMRRPQFLAEYFAHEVFRQVVGWRRFRAALEAWLPWPSADLREEASAIFPSHFMEQLYRRAGFRFRESAIVYHGIQPDFQGAGDHRPAQASDDHSLRLLFAGRLVEIKGVHTAVEAMPHILSALPGHDVRLTLVGDDQDQPYIERLRQRIEQLGLEDRVHFSSVVAESDLPALFARHHVYLFPSLYEPFSLTLIHALRSGIPVVASRAGGTPEIVLEDKTGLLFDPADSRDLARQVVRLARDPQLARTLAGEGRRKAEKYTFTRMIDQVEFHLEQRLRGGP